MVSTADALIAAADTLRTALRPLLFSLPVTHVYNPLDYAWAPHTAYPIKPSHGRSPWEYL